MCLSFGCSSVFSPSFEGFFFHFFVASNTACRVGQQLDELLAFPLLNIFQ
ncbi:hypothetical protein CBY84_004546 [Salmonella enterica subsp. enterica serovar Javiana]|nr:hypothetical protein [Salmonella enterica subsp. enterica serovar Javiana]